MSTVAECPASVRTARPPAITRIQSKALAPTPGRRPDGSSSAVVTWGSPDPGPASQPPCSDVTHTSRPLSKPARLYRPTG